MANQYTGVTHAGCTRLVNLFFSLVGTLIGVLLFFGSFVVLWMNEGAMNLATIAQQSTPASAATVDPSLDGEFLAATGKLSSSETLGDELFVRPGNYLQLERNVEMYAWVQTVPPSEGNPNGSYMTQWTSDPAQANSYGHGNPALPFGSDSWKVSNITLGAYKVDPQRLSFPSGTQIAEAAIELDDGWSIKNDYIVNSASALTSPKVGDIRVSYTVVPNNVDVTLFGKASAGQLVPYEVEGTAIYRAFDGSRKGAIKTLDSEYRFLRGIVRVIGFFLMWLGLVFCFKRINKMLSVLPFLSSARRFVINVVMLGVAALFSLLTIVISTISHNIFLLIGVCMLLVVGIVAWNRLRAPEVVPVTA